MPQQRDGQPTPVPDQPDGGPAAGTRSQGAPAGSEPSAEMPVGVVLARRPGVTRWARVAWSVEAILPHAGPADWQALRRDGDTVLYHAATLPLVLRRAEAEAYQGALHGTPPSVWVFLRGAPGAPEGRPEPVAVTASLARARDQGEVGDDRIERVAMPPALEAWIGAFVAAHYREEPFRKRQRVPDAGGAGAGEDGLGDPRIRQASDVYRPPADRRRPH